MKKHMCASFGSDELEELFSNFIIDSWGYSKVSCFARNEKQFEMSYIYRQKSRMSASTIAGQAYHEALEQFFKSMQEGVFIDIVGLEKIAFEYINAIPANTWKLQKTTPTIDKCIEMTCKVSSALLANFLAYIYVYKNHIKRIIAVEVKLHEWVTINGVDIPIPCVAKIDLIIETHEGKIVIIDHKSKKSFTDEKDIKLVAAKQAITYVAVVEAKYDFTVDEVWFIENKYSKNKDGSPQLVTFPIVVDADTRKLFEAMLYEPLKRMVEAISDPDYVYMINDSDNFVDKAEMFEFWMQTMIAEVDDFDIPENKKEMVAKRLKKIRDTSIKNISPVVIKKFKENAASFIKYDLTNKNMTTAEKIEHVLRSFGKLVSVEHEFSGFSSNTYLLEASMGITIPSIYKHRLDVANALNVANIRMSKELVVHNGKSYLAIESSKKRENDLLYDVKHLDGMKIPIGMDNYGNVIYWDLDNHATPHMLICGATGSGKSVSIKTTIEYMLAAGIDDIYIFDPKNFDFNKYKGVKGVHVFTEIEDIEEQMKLLVEEMEDRVQKGHKRKTIIIFDEFADAVTNARKGNALKVYESQVDRYLKDGTPKYKNVHVDTLKSLEENQRLLLQKGRSLGFRLMSATQRASTKIITGDAKVNFSVQICFRVPTETDSRVVLDEGGAECLSKYGDGLMKSPEYEDIVRFQGFFKKD